MIVYEQKRVQRTETNLKGTETNRKVTYYLCYAKVGTLGMSKVLFKKRPVKNTANFARYDTHGSKIFSVTIDRIDDGLVFCSMR